MPLFKCKMCGGTLEVQGNETVATCEYCGMQQTLPKHNDDEKRANLYDRANQLRRNHEYDKAIGIYEQIINEDNTDAEAYWSLVLCQYGIQYEEDPATHQMIPTVNRAQFSSVISDENYKSALKYADTYQRSIYELEAKNIDKIQKGILEISQKEDPFDIFICYKESDNNGKRTPDSVLAQDLYYQLTQEGYKVFFARITLEDKLGTAYEPYIFAALNSSKVMVVLGTKPEFFNAVWVKNEWSRYLALIKKGEKKMLIPAYKDMNPYDLPDEFSHLQAQDMSKLGFMQDLIRGIKKIVVKDEPKTTVIKETVVTGGGGSSPVNTTALLKRAFMYLEDEAWDGADDYCEKVLDADPENAQAYVVKLCIEFDLHGLEDIASAKNISEERIEEIKRSNNYKRIMRFGDDKLKKQIEGYITSNKEKSLNEHYEDAKHDMATAETEEDFLFAAGAFESISNYKDSARLASECRLKAKDCVYCTAVELMNDAESEGDCEEAIEIFETIRGYKDTDRLIEECREKSKNIHVELIYKGAKSEMAKNTIESCNKAIEIFKTIPDYKDSELMVGECLNNIEQLKLEAVYMSATKKMASNTEAGYQEAIKIFENILHYRDSAELTETCRIKIDELRVKAEALRVEKERKAEELRIKRAKRKKKVKKFFIISAIVLVAFITLCVILGEMMLKSDYERAVSLMNEGKFEEAVVVFNTLDGYEDSASKISIANAVIELKKQNYDAISNVTSAGATLQITYDVDGGSIQASDSTDFIYDASTAFDAFKNAEKEGYRFVEWSYVDCIYAGADNKVILTLKAVYTDGYFIEYDLAGGTANNPSEYHKDGDAVTLTAPTKKGYTFAGWLGTDISSPNVSVTIPSGSYGDRSYTATWVANDYTVTYDADGGVSTADTQVVTFDVETTLATADKVGYTFGGWYFESTEYKNGAWTLDQDVTLKAKWIPNTDTKYTVNHHIQNKNNDDYTLKDTDALTGTTDAEIKPAVKTYTGFTAPSVQTVTIKPDGSLVVDYYYPRNDYTITFISNGGGNVASISGKYETAPALMNAERDGYTFGGWFTDVGLTTAFSEIPANNITLYAYWTEENKPGDLSYSGTGSISINGYNGTGDTLHIPTYIGGVAVTEIADEAFVNKYSLKTVVIPDTITAIGYSAFEGCTGLESLTIPFVGGSSSNNRYLGHLFGEQSYDYRGTKVPESLKTVIVTKGTSIAANAFEGCSDITSITLPETLTSIGSSAFDGCSAITSITIPDGVTSIGAYAFEGCSGLSKVYISDISNWYKISFGDATANPMHYASYLYVNGEEITEVEFEDGMTSIGSYALYNITSIKKIIVPDSVTTIGLSAFKGCTGLESLTVPFVGGSSSNNRYLGHLFGEQSYDYRGTKVPESLKTVIVTKGTSIAANAFEGCSDITSITLPETLTSIGSSAFDGCSGITTIHFEGTTTQWESINKGYDWDYGTGAYTVSCNNGNVDK